MKTKIIALALLIGMSGAASAAKVSYQGTVMALTVTPACGTDIPVGDHQLTLYSPRGLGENGADSYLAFFRQRNGSSLKVTGALPGNNKSYTAENINGRGVHQPNSGKFTTFSTIPANVTAATQTIVINAKITNYQGSAGCTATIQGALVLRRDP